MVHDKAQGEEQQTSSASCKMPELDMETFDHLMSTVQLVSALMLALAITIFMADVLFITDYRSMLLWSGTTGGSNFKEFVVADLERKGFNFTVQLGPPALPANFPTVDTNRYILDVRQALLVTMASNSFEPSFSEMNADTVLFDTVFHVTRSHMDMDLVNAHISANQLTSESIMYTSRVGMSVMCLTVALIFATGMHGFAALSGAKQHLTAGNPEPWRKFAQFAYPATLIMMILIITGTISFFTAASSGITQMYYPQWRSKIIFEFTYSMATLILGVIAMAVCTLAFLHSMDKLCCCFRTEQSSEDAPAGVPVATESLDSGQLSGEHMELPVTNEPSDSKPGHIGAITSMPGTPARLC